MAKKKAKWYGDEARKIMFNAGMKALYEGGEVILAESRKEVPHATGNLQRMSGVDEDWPKGTVYIWYSTPYAIRQHEDLTLRHPDPTNPISTPGRKAKYLEDPFNRMKDKVMTLARLRVKKALRDAK